MILFNHFQRQYQKYKKEIDTAIQGVLDSGWYILGQQVKDFEQKLAQYSGVEYAVGVASGTEAITLALMVYDIGLNDEVITTSLTAFPTITGILQAGATPKIVDILDKNGLINVQLIEEKITKKTKAIIPVHLYGQPCAMDKIMELAKAYQLVVIEDCAQAIGARYLHKKVGSWGDCGAFSFYPTKNLGAYGDAGAVTTNHKETYLRLLSLRNYGQKNRYEHEEKGINSRLDEMQAAILNAKISFLDKDNQKRKDIARLYRQNLKHIMFLEEDSHSDAVYHLFVIKDKNRDKLKQYLEEKEIQTLIHYPMPINKQKAYLWQKEEVFSICQKFTKEILSLPCYPELLESELSQIINGVNSFYEK